MTTSSLCSYVFQSTPLIRGATATCTARRGRTRISIHAPHTRGDRLPRRPRPSSQNFNPRPSYEGRPSATATTAAHRNFNPRPSYEGRRAGRPPWAVRTHFNPRPSYEGRPVRGAVVVEAEPISIHAPHTRGDAGARRCQTVSGYFNPRPSYEGRRSPSARPTAASHFNPRPSYEGRPDCRADLDHPRRISIHAPHTRGDRGRASRARRAAHFNPRPSYEGRPTPPGKSRWR